MKNYLHECLDLPKELRRTSIPEGPDFEQVERRARKLRSKTELAYEDVRSIVNQRFWGQFRKVPREEDFEAQSKGLSVNLWNHARKTRNKAVHKAPKLT